MDWDNYIAVIEDRITATRSALEGKGPWPDSFVNLPHISQAPPRNVKRRLNQLLDENRSAIREVEGRMHFIRELQIRRLSYGTVNNPVAVDVQI